MDYIYYCSYIFFGAIGLYVTTEIVTSMRNQKKPAPTPIEDARDSLHLQVKDLPFFIGVDIEGKGITANLVVKFSKEPSFDQLIGLPLSYRGYYVETKIVKQKTK